MALKFSCLQHKKYNPDVCVDCENGVTEELDNMIASLELELKNRRMRNK